MRIVNVSIGVMNIPATGNFLLGYPAAWWLTFVISPFVIALLGAWLIQGKVNLSGQVG